MPYQVGGNIGTSALMLKPLDSQGTYVLELSSYQLELTPSLSPDVAVLLNVSADHLERHGGFDGYIQAKREIFKNQYGTKSSVIGIDDPHGFNLHATLKREAGRVVIPISGQTKAPGGVYVLDGILFDDMDGRNKRVLDLDEDCPTLPGEHNHQNAAAAYATARLRGIPPEIIKAALPSFPGLAHRQELVATINGIEYVNDSKATNADAADKAMDCYDDIYWIVGGRPAEGGINALSRHFPHVRKAFLIGEAEAAFAEVLGKAGVALERCGTLDRAVKAAHEAAQADAIEDAAILLSPACKSWDQFPNFETRGDAFRSLVQGLGKQGGGAS
ncbi:MAG: UDP-N-acetylmuramoyl-L-alanine--D-glutamate ligase [Rhodospirillaceae bacterium]